MANRFDYSIPGLRREYDYRDKRRAADIHIKYMLARTQQMFKWDGLPNSVPARILELYLQVNGNVAWYRHEGELYVFCGGLGGKPDEYYMPTIYTIANPALNLTVNARINEDCVVMTNDSMYMGMIPMYSQYATGMAETELSLYVAAIQTRLVSLVSAQDDRTRMAAEKLLRDIESGQLGVVAETPFLEGLKSQPYGNSSATGVITHLIELEQYLKAAWYNEIGLDANYNMKRESLSMAESQMNSDALLPLVDDMLSCRQRGADQVNAMFGTSISVSLASSWEDNVEELDEEIAAAEDPEEDPSETEGEPEEKEDE